MADWTFIPDYPGNVEPIAPPTIIQRYEDAGEQRREKHSATRRRWREKYVFDGAVNAKAARDFYDARRLLTTFTRITYDPGDTNPETDEATVRFEKPFRVRRTAVDVYEATIQMIEVLP